MSTPRGGFATYFEFFLHGIFYQAHYWLSNEPLKIVINEAATELESLSGDGWYDFVYPLGVPESFRDAIEASGLPAQEYLDRYLAGDDL